MVTETASLASSVHWLLSSLQLELDHFACLQSALTPSMSAAIAAVLKDVESRKSDLFVNK